MIYVPLSLSLPLPLLGKCGLVFLFFQPETSTSHPARQRLPPGDSGCQGDSSVAVLVKNILPPPFPSAPLPSERK